LFLSLPSKVIVKGLEGITVEHREEESTNKPSLHTGPNGSHDNEESSNNAGEENTLPVKATNDVISQKRAKVPILILEDILPIFVPDRSGILYTSSSLIVDDAPWISSSMTQRKDVKFVHKGLKASEALLLGAKSLREQLFSGDEILCPNPRVLKSLLMDDGVSEVLRDLLALSDTLSGKAMHVMYDDREHRCESLLHPGMSDAQGPALVVYIEGPALTSEAICKILAPPEILPPFTEPGGNSFISDNDEENLYPRTGGKRLSTTFAITDCLQIITGREFIIFDPCASFLIGEGSADGPDKEGAGSGEKSSKDSKKVIYDISVVMYFYMIISVMFNIIYL
jgi:hypothetical protein